MLLTKRLRHHWPKTRCWASLQVGAWHEREKSQAEPATGNRTPAQLRAAQSQLDQNAMADLKLAA